MKDSIGTMRLSVRRHLQCSPTSLNHKLNQLRIECWRTPSNWIFGKRTIEDVDEDCGVGRTDLVALEVEESDGGIFYSRGTARSFFGNKSVHQILAHRGGQKEEMEKEKKKNRALGQLLYPGPLYV